MKANRSKLRALLDEVLPSAGERCGPGRDSVLEMVREERLRCRRMRRLCSAAMVLALAALLLVWPRSRPLESPIASASPAAQISVSHVNDEQLFALLHGT